MFTKHNPKKNLLKDTKAMAKLAKAGLTVKMVESASREQIKDYIRVSVLNSPLSFGVTKNWVLGASDAELTRIAKEKMGK